MANSLFLQIGEVEKKDALKMIDLINEKLREEKGNEHKDLVTLKETIESALRSYSKAEETYRMYRELLDKSLETEKGLQATPLKHKLKAYARSPLRSYRYLKEHDSSLQELKAKFTTAQQQLKESMQKLTQCYKLAVNRLNLLPQIEAERKVEREQQRVNSRPR